METQQQRELDSFRREMEAQQKLAKSSQPELLKRKEQVQWIIQAKHFTPSNSTSLEQKNGIISELIMSGMERRATHSNPVQDRGKICSS
jgi:hypothetical protein